MTTRSRTAATPCEVSEPRGAQGPRGHLTLTRPGAGGEGRALGPREERLATRSSLSSVRRWDSKWPGLRKLWEGVEGSGLRQDAGGRFLETGTALVASLSSGFALNLFCASLSGAPQDTG